MIKRLFTLHRPTVRVARRPAPQPRMRWYS